MENLKRFESGKFISRGREVTLSEHREKLIDVPRGKRRLSQGIELSGDRDEDMFYGRVRSPFFDVG